MFGSCSVYAVTVRAYRDPSHPTQETRADVLKVSYVGNGDFAGDIELILGCQTTSALRFSSVRVPSSGLIAVARGRLNRYVFLVPEKSERAWRVYHLALKERNVAIETVEERQIPLYSP
jgi:hypothetical protein